MPLILNATTSGTVRDVVQLPNGQYLIGGSFSSINGVRARNLARLYAAFTAACPANGTVYSLAVQPAGRVLVGGVVDSLAAASRRLVGLLLPSGALDASFDAAFSALTLDLAPLPAGVYALRVHYAQGGPVVRRVVRRVVRQ